MTNGWDNNDIGQQIFVNSCHSWSTNQMLSFFLLFRTFYVRWVLMLSPSTELWFTKLRLGSNGVTLQNCARCLQRILSKMWKQNSQKSIGHPQRWWNDEDTHFKYKHPFSYSNSYPSKQIVENRVRCSLLQEFINFKLTTILCIFRSASTNGARQKIFFAHSSGW